MKLGPDLGIQVILNSLNWAGYKPSQISFYTRLEFENLFFLCTCDAMFAD